ncbi:hypothetical protein DFH27DRAFT_521932 [Peziza echinospora]|nr:hypothetical protein DFH27DRAFT_521932 [Peziza echinospora]
MFRPMAKLHFNTLKFFRTGAQFARQLSSTTRTAQKCWAVARGRQTGIFYTAQEAINSTSGYSFNMMRKFKDPSVARAWLADNGIGINEEKKPECADCIQKMMPGNHGSEQKKQEQGTGVDHGFSALLDWKRK